MEEEIDLLFNDTVVNETDIEGYSHGDLQDCLYFLEKFISCFVGIISDFLMIIVIYQNPRLRTRLYVIIFNYAIVDSIYIICCFYDTLAFLLHIYYIYLEDFIPFCVTMYINVAMLIVCSILMALLLSRRFFQIIPETVYKLYIIIYSFAISLIVLGSMLCTQYMYVEFTLMIAFFSYVLTLLMLIREEYCSTNQQHLYENVAVRLNVTRIFVYNHGVVINLIILRHVVASRVYEIWRFFIATKFLSSCYILLYLIYADANFKLCLCKVVRLKSKREESEVIFRLTDERNMNDFVDIDLKEANV